MHIISSVDLTDAEKLAIMDEATAMVRRTCLAT